MPIFGIRELIRGGIKSLNIFYEFIHVGIGQEVVKII